MRTGHSAAVQPIEPWLARTGLGLSQPLVNSTEISLHYDAEARRAF